jgi:hypothetical protein
VSRLPLIAFFLLAQAASVAAEVRPNIDASALVGGGVDSNLYLQVSASPTSPNFHPTPSPWFARTNPSFELELGLDRLRMSLVYDADLRAAEGSGLLAVQNATLEVAFPGGGPLRGRIGALVGRYDNTLYPQDRFLSFGGTAGLTLRISARLRAEAGYRLERRAFADPVALGADHDVAHIVEIRLGTNVAPALTVGTTADFLALTSTASDPTLPATTLRRARGGLDADLSSSTSVSILGSAWGGIQWYGDGGSDLQGGGGAAVVFRLGQRTRLVARYDFTISRAQSDATTSYGRQVALLGLWVHAGTPRSVRPSLPSPPETANEAPLVVGMRVRFRLRAPGAASVAIIGSWNDWAVGVPEQRLVATADPALWEAWLTTGQGLQRYRFIVDGRTVRPIDAPQYRPDGFGGEDGLVDVP